MRTDKKEERAKFRVIVRNEETLETESFPIYDNHITLDELVKKLQEFIKKI